MRVRRLRLRLCVVSAAMTLQLVGRRLTNVRCFTCVPLLQGGGQLVRRRDGFHVDDPHQPHGLRALAVPAVVQRNVGHDRVGWHRGSYALRRLRCACRVHRRVRIPLRGALDVASWWIPARELAATTAPLCETDTLHRCPSLPAAQSIGYVDFAGGGTVHVLGGTAALVCTVYLKPRIGVFHEDGRRTRVGCNPVLVLLGCFLLWVGWFAFNAGSAGGLSDGKSLIAARAATNTAGASGTGCLTAMLYSYLTASKRGGFDMFTTITGLLSALVGVTPSAAYVPMWVAFIIGFLSAGIGVVVSHAVERMMIDDPVDAFAVHGASGIVGLLAAGIFADTTYGQPAGFTPIAQGLVHGGGFRLLGVQALGVTVIFVWSLLMTTVFLVIASRLVSIRTSRSDELTGTNSGLELMMACPDTVRAEVVSQLGEIDDDSAGPIKLPRHLRNRVKVSPHTSSHSPHGCAHDRHPRDEVATAGAGTAAVAMDAKAAAGSHA